MLTYTWKPRDIFLDNTSEVTLRTLSNVPVNMPEEPVIANGEITITVPSEGSYKAVVKTKNTTQTKRVDVNDPSNDSSTVQASELNAKFVAKWKANTAYSAGEAVLSPTGDVVTAKANFTSGSSFSAANWNLSGAYLNLQNGGSDVSKDMNQRLNISDVVGGKGSVINIDHRADGSGKANAQTYALDIHNMPGAQRAIVVHQYSSLTEAVRLDNTGSKATVRIVNTENQTLNPGGDGTGEAVIFDDHGTIRFKLQGDGGIYTEPKDSSHGIWVKSPVTGTKSSIYVDHRAPSNGVQIAVAATAAGFYPLLVGGQNYGPTFSTATDGGVTLLLVKNGTGSGSVLSITNKGTGVTALFKDATVSVAQITAAGEYENLAAGKGIILKSADGTRYRVTVANGGAITATAI